MTLRALVVDDEPLARRKLKGLIADVAWLEWLGEASDGEEALERIDSLKPDVVFLDIQMPGVLGTEVARQSRHRPSVIFTTAYDRYAVAAFELQAVDYLLKPFGRERFEKAIARVRELERSEGPSALERASHALRERGQISRLFVRHRGRIVPVSMDSIERLEAQDDYVALHSKGQSFLVHLTLNEFERRLDPERFLRIHRRHIVNLDHVESIAPLDNGRLEVHLDNGTRLSASRARERDLRNRAV